MSDRPGDRPHVVARLDDVLTGLGEGDTGAVWRLQEPHRQLDANVVRLPPGGGVDPHTGPAEDVLLQVVAGSGAMTTEDGALALTPGTLVWMPRRSRRSLRAGDEGMTYLTVHTRRAGVVIGPPPPPENAVDRLTRWQLFGGAWRVVDRSADSATVSLCRCDGGEELERLTSGDPQLLEWLGERSSSSD